MASKAAAKAVQSVKPARTMPKVSTLAERMVWEKYNKPSRSLFQALGAFENNGVGQRVVRLQSHSPRLYLLHLLTGIATNRLEREGLQGLLLHCNGVQTESTLLFRGIFFLLIGVYGERITWPGQRDSNVEGKSHK